MEEDFYATHEMLTLSVSDLLFHNNARTTSTIISIFSWLGMEPPALQPQNLKLGPTFVMVDSDSG